MTIAELVRYFADKLKEDDIYACTIVQYVLEHIDNAWDSPYVYYYKCY